MSRNMLTLTIRSTQLLDEESEHTLLYGDSKSRNDVIRAFMEFILEGDTEIESVKITHPDGSISWLD